MTTTIRRLRQGHQFLAYQGMYPVFLSSLLATALFAGRVYRSRSTTYVFLGWNLILAWIPYLAALWASRVHKQNPRRWWLLAIPGLLWLAFFPNAPYLVTDLIHLAERPPVPLWYDVGMLTAFAWTGLFLAVYSLRAIQKLVQHYLGPIPSWLFALTVLGLGGVGVYLGRFLRWNSWDLVLNPKGVLNDIAIRFADPLSQPRAFGVTLLFAAILLVCYLTVTSREAA